MSEPARLCLFARAPVLGAVKTRLAQAVGDEAALAAHEELVRAALNQLGHVPGLRSQLWIAGATDHARVLEWARTWQLEVFPQQGLDLGARMCDAIETCLAAGVPGLVVGTDCPDIGANYAQQAARALRDHDLVLGPAEDGGYGLIGLRVAAPEIFDDMPWGSDRVFGETMARARQRGLTSVVLDTIWDVDDAAGWARFQARN